jgi:hypothetical protein
MKWNVSFHSRWGDRGQPPGQNPAGCLVQHDSEIDEATRHRDVRDVHRPDLVRPLQLSWTGKASFPNVPTPRTDRSAQRPGRRSKPFRRENSQSSALSKIQLVWLRFPDWAWSKERLRVRRWIPCERSPRETVCIRRRRRFINCEVQEKRQPTKEEREAKTAKARWDAEHNTTARKRLDDAFCETSNGLKPSGWPGRTIG